MFNILRILYRFFNKIYCSLFGMIIKFFTEYSSETLVANPSYMSLRNHLKNTPPLFEFSSIELLASSFFEILKEREGSNKKKYKDFEGFINYEEIETSIIFSKNKNDFTKQAFENRRPIMERLDKK